MTNEIITVIIPCYNVEPYIERCLNSVFNQTHNNLEIIVIDDGSTDATADKIQTFASDTRLKFVTQAKSGVSAARNKGLELASGDFIAFVDGDDWLEQEMYSRMVDVLLADRSDMAVCNYNLDYGNRADYRYSKIIRETVDIVDPYSYFCKYCACQKPNNYIWSRLYRSNIIKASGVKFCDYSHGEDTLFNFMLLPHIKRVSFIDDGLYNYYQRTSSNVYNIANRSNIAKMYADTFDTLAEYYETNGFEEYLKVLPIHAFTRMRSVFFYSRLAGLKDETIAENLRVGFNGRKIADYLTGKNN